MILKFLFVFFIFQFSEAKLKKYYKKKFEKLAKDYKDRRLNPVEFFLKV